MVKLFAVALTILIASCAGVTETGNPRPTDTGEPFAESFEILDPRPLSLFVYLFEKYPERTFTVYLTQTLVGYLYDDSLPGPDGGDLREYFFLNEDVLLHVDAEIFSSTEFEFLSLLEGISFF
jgi:hypothetical protein